MLNSEQKHSNMIMASSINEIIGEGYRFFKIIEFSEEIERYIGEEKKSSKDSVEQFFQRLASNVNDVNQIRFINMDGMEEIGVDIVNGVAPLIIEDSNLQNRRNSNYFIDAIENTDSICISELSLNMKDGEIEIPYNPMYRISRVIKNVENLPVGVLVLNLKADRVIDLFKYGYDDDNMIDRMLLNYRKEVIVSKGGDGYFPFMFEDSYCSGGIAIKLGEVDFSEGELKELYDAESEMNFAVKPITLFEDESKNIIAPVAYIVSRYNDEAIMIMNSNSFFNKENMRKYIFSRWCLLLLIATIFFYYMLKKGKNLEVNRFIANTTDDGVMITDSKNRIEYVNQSYEYITGFSHDEVMGKTPSEFKSGRHGKEFYKNMWKGINAKGFWKGELWDKRKDGILYPKMLEIHVLKNKLGRVVNYIGIFKDMSDDKSNSDFVDKLVNYNQITNLPNFNLLKRTIDERIRDGESFGLAYIMISNYDSLQLSYGNFSAGKFIGYHANEFRKIFGNRNMVSHVSEKKFIIDIVERNNIDNIEVFMKKMVKYFKGPFDFKDTKVQIEIKAAVVRYPQNGTNSIELLENAELALDYAISHKWKSYVIYNDEIKFPVLRKLNIRKELSKALENEEFEVYLQPKVESSTERMFGVEALLRWNNRLLGSVSPVEFIPVAEQSKFILEIDEYVLEKSTHIMRKIKDSHGLDLFVSVNISGITFENRDVHKMVMEAMKRNGVSGEFLTLEITETTLMNNIDNINDQLMKLRQEGVRISIDDFGTGFSSLSYLKLFETDELKIDRSFIKDYPKGDNGKIAEYITLMANALEIVTVAEGAETKEQVDFLKKIGCTYIQGYYFSKPMNLEDFMKYMKSRNEI
jgi:PAS domain S-box-containing protein